MTQKGFVFPFLSIRSGNTHRGERVLPEAAVLSLDNFLKRAVWFWHEAEHELYICFTQTNFI